MTLDANAGKRIRMHGISTPQHLGNIFPMVATFPSPVGTLPRGLQPSGVQHFSEACNNLQPHCTTSTNVASLHNPVAALPRLLQQFTAVLHHHQKVATISSPVATLPRRVWTFPEGFTTPQPRCNACPRGAPLRSGSPGATSRR